MSKVIRATNDLQQIVGQITNIDEAIGKCKDLIPIPGTYVVCYLHPKMKKDKDMIQVPKEYLYDPAKMGLWISYSDYHMCQGMVLAKGETLDTIDGKKEKMVFEIGDIVYLSSNASAEAFIHGGLILYHIYQRNVICKVKDRSTIDDPLKDGVRYQKKKKSA